jgi:CBS-domain-containing membrane protein
MNIAQLLTPKSAVAWLSITDTVRDAFDHFETYELGAAPLLHWNGRYVGTVTEADLRRHIANMVDRSVAAATPLAKVERRSRNAAVTVDCSMARLVEQATAHPFVPVVDDAARFLGIVDRRRIFETRLPSAA